MKKNSKKRLIMIFSILLLIVVIWKIPSLFCEDTDEDIFYNIGGFEKAYEITGGTSKNNIIKFKTENNNKFLYFETKNSSGYYWILPVKKVSQNTVLEFDFKTDSIFPNGGIDIKNEENESYKQIISLISPNTIKTGKKIVGTFNEKEWNNIALSFDFEENLLNVYLNNILVADNVSISEYNPSDILFRFRFGSNNEIGTNFSIDNLKIYKGSAPRNDILDTEENTLLPYELRNNDNNIIYKRPNQDEIKKIMADKSSHPRIMINKEKINRILIDYQNDEDIKYMGDEVIKTANSYLKTLESDKVNVIVRDSAHFLHTSRAVYERTKFLSMAYILTNDSKYADALYSIYEIVAEYDNWEPDSYICVAEMTAAFAIGYDWLYDYWDANQKKFLENTMIEKSLLMTRWSYYINSSWVSTITNFNAVSNSAGFMAAVAIYDKNPNLCSEIISNSIRSVEYTLIGFSDNGTWSESVNYWDYTLDYLANMLYSMDVLFGTDFNLSKAPGFSNTYNFRLAAEGSTGINNFHDSASSRSSTIGTETFFWAAGKFNDENLSKMRLYNIKNKTNKVSPYDLIWYNKNNKSTDYNIDSDYCFEGLAFCSFRGNNIKNPNNSWLSFHGGYAETNHSHLDGGNFVFDAGGVRWAIDFGLEDYNSYDSRDEKFLFYKLRPEGHNLYVVNPTNEETNYGQLRDSYVSLEKEEHSLNKSFAILNLTDAYRNTLSNAKRGLMLTDQRSSVIVRDEITFINENSDFYWFMHIPKNSNVTINNNVAKITAKDVDGVDKTLIFIIDSDLEKYEFGVMDAEPLTIETQVIRGSLVEGEYKKLYLHSNYNKNNESHFIQCKMVLQDGDLSNDIDMPKDYLADWSTDGDSFVVSFDTDGGSSIESQVINNNGKIVRPSNPTKLGYTFKEWQLNETTYDFNKPVTKNIQLKAVWEKIENFVIKNNIISVPINTVGEMLQVLSQDISSIKIFDENNNELPNTTILRTNYYVEINNIKYNIAVLGDVMADGKITIHDLSKAYAAIAKSNFSGYTDAERYALDIDCDGVTDIYDLSDIFEAIKNKN